jgi:hypothetical protein
MAVYGEVSEFLISIDADAEVSSAGLLNIGQKSKKILSAFLNYCIPRISLKLE